MRITSEFERVSRRSFLFLPIANFLNNNNVDGVNRKSDIGTNIPPSMAPLTAIAATAPRMKTARKMDQIPIGSCGQRPFKTQSNWKKKSTGLYGYKSRAEHRSAPHGRVASVDSAKIVARQQEPLSERVGLEAESSWRICETSIWGSRHRKNCSGPRLISPWGKSRGASGGRSSRGASRRRGLFPWLSSWDWSPGTSHGRWFSSAAARGQLPLGVAAAAAAAAGFPRATSGLTAFPSSGSPVAAAYC